MAPHFRGTFSTQWLTVMSGKPRWMTAIDQGEWPMSKESLGAMKDNHMHHRLIAHVPIEEGGKIRIVRLVVKEWGKDGKMVSENKGLVEDMRNRGMDISEADRHVGVVKQRRYEGRHNK